MNAQTCLSIRAVSPEPLLLGHAQSGCRQNLRQNLSPLKPLGSLRLHMVTKSNSSKCNKYKHRVRWLKYSANSICYQSMLRRTWAPVQFRQGLHFSRTCTKWAYIGHMLLVITQTRLSMHAVLLEPSLLSHIHTMGVYMACFISPCSNKP